METLAVKEKRYSVKRIVFIVLKYALMIFAVITVFLPLLPIFIGSFKSGSEFYETGLLEFPAKWHFENYKTAFVDGHMLLGFGNTLFMLAVSITVSVLIGAMTAYVLNRFKFRGKAVVSGMFLSATLIPAITNNIATFQLLAKMGVIDTYWAGILLFSGTDIISVYIFLQFMSNVSNALDESAMIDGASYFRIFAVIILPLLLPAIATVGIIKGVAIYNDFTTPFLFMSDTDLAMISTSLYYFKGPFASHQEIICAGVIAITLPILAIFLGAQRWIYSGLTMGSVKE